MTSPRQPLDGWPGYALPRSQKRRVFLAGKLLADAMADDPECRKAVLQELNFFLTQPRDRQLFDLPPLPPVCPVENKPGLRALMHFQGSSFQELLPPEPHVGRVETFNIPGPGRESTRAAVAAMDATVAAAPQLKRETSGRASPEVQKPALHYALYWGSADRPDVAAMADRVADSLHALALREHQAIVILCGRPSLPHVHVLVNRVHPATGRAADNRRSWVVLSEWAKSYEHHPDIQPTSQLHPDHPDTA